MKTNCKSNQRAVAPIIATLLMVAVAVVGGILIFVFTQGFFADEQVTGFKADSLYVAGYNAKDGTSEDLSSSGGTSLECPNAKLDGKLTSGDCLLLFVDNRGGDPLAIGEVRVYGTSYSPSTNTTLSTNPTDGPVCDDGKVAGGSTINDAEFRVYTSAEVNSLIIEPNTSSSICITYFGNDVAAGKVIPVQIITENGQILLENVRNGARQTSETGTFTTLGGSTVPTGTLNYAAVNTGADNRIDVTWDALDDQGDPTIYRLTSSVDGVLVNAANTFSHNIDTDCTVSHTLSLTTSNANGAGPSGGSTLADTGVTLNHGSLGLGITDNNDRSVTVSWTEGEGFADINCPMSIAVSVTTAGTISTNDSDGQPGVATGAVYNDGDSVIATYTSTITDGGYGPVVTNTGATTIDLDCAGTFSNPVAVTPTNPSGDNISFSWTHDVTNGCETSTGYQVFWELTGDDAGTGNFAVAAPGGLSTTVNICTQTGASGTNTVAAGIRADYEDGSDGSGAITTGQSPAVDCS